MPSIVPTAWLTAFADLDKVGNVLLYVIALFGFNLVFWGCISLLRLVVEQFGRIGILRRLFKPVFPQRAAAHTLTPSDVAIIMPAYNEELVIAKSIQSLLVLVPKENIYIISDGSKDSTATIARGFGVNVLEPANQGKAGALKTGIEHFKLGERYTAVLFVDADTIISPNYLKYALPYMEDPRVAAVAGFAKTLWEPETTGFWNLFVLAYRDRAYTLFQYVLKYGQAWLPASVTHIVPGFCSMYRASILKHIDITAPGLVIEDYNMTFEVHRHKLGKIVLDPRVYGNTQDPDNLYDYYKQIRRWNLGLWQTIRLHGFWFSAFSIVLLAHMAEVVLAAIAFFLLPLAALFVGVVSVVGEAHVPGTLLTAHDYFTNRLHVWDALLLAFLIDYALSLIVGIALRRLDYLWYGLGFFIMRFLDMWVFLATFPRAFIERSNGAWVSPTRRSIETTAPQQVSVPADI